MSDMISRRPHQGTVRFYLAAAAGILPMAVAIVIINYWIYYARIEFALLHPDYVAEQPATISRAISDPSIGEPFAFWIGICAVLVFVGVMPISGLYWRAGRSLPPSRRRTRTILLAAAPCLLVLQAIASVGMVMLSSYRFPDHDAVHMAGSYLFFIADSLVVLLAGVVCVAITRDAVAAAHLRSDASIDPRLSRFRGPFAIGAVLLAVLYLVLFLTKNVALPVGNELLYAAYVTSEPLLITYFLTVFATFFWDIIRALRTAGRPSATSRRRD